MCKFSSIDETGSQNLVSDTGMKSDCLGSNNNNNNNNANNNNGWSSDLGSCKSNDDDFFGVGWKMSTGRPTMMSAKYLEKEERRKVLKISVNKLKRIEDPESSLRRSVLINNTMKRLQRETREEKQKSSRLYNKRTTYVTSPPPLSRRSDIDTDEPPIQYPSAEESRITSTTNTSSGDLQLLDITNLPELNNGSSTTTNTTTSHVKSDMLGCDEPMPEDLLESLTSDTHTHSHNLAHGHTHTIPDSRCSRKRSLDDIDDCDVTDVLSQFYMPPTPLLLTSISDDEDDELNVVDIDYSCCSSNSSSNSLSLPPSSKKPRLDSSLTDSPSDTDFSSSDSLRNSSDCVLSISSNSLSSDFIPDSDLLFPASKPLPSPSLQCLQSSYSCGLSSVFNDIQSVVFPNLMASLET